LVAIGLVLLASVIKIAMVVGPVYGRIPLPQN